MDIIHPVHSLAKAERLSSRTAISNLMSKGKWGVCPGMKYCYLSPTGEDINRIMVSVPKRYFKRAVKRNLLKRRIRESYRLHKNLLEAEGGVDIMFLYDTGDILNFSCLEALVSQVLREIK